MALRPASRFLLRRVLLPPPASYYRAQEVKLLGRAEWRSARCPFHEDHRPSLRVRIENGAFRCMACGVRGHDVLGFHRRRRGLGFVDAARQLGAFEVAQ